MNNLEIFRNKRDSGDAGYPGPMGPPGTPRTTETPETTTTPEIHELPAPQPLPTAIVYDASEGQLIMHNVLFQYIIQIYPQKLN